MSKRIPKNALKEIHNTIKYIWEYDIPNDYEKGYLLKEDTFKNSLYFHLRTRLGSLLEKYNIMIYTEFDTDKFRGKKQKRRADMILAQVDFDKAYFLGDCITRYIAVFELKNKGDYTKAAEDIYKDYEKTKEYIQNYDLGENCHYYIAAIWECQADSKWWVDKDVKWAKGKLTELNADYDSKEKMRFYIKEHK
ncbi:MAG: hypothetical protein IKU52_01065 [Clostridia bacterium]|nr:hypothetical protein [Clostridia bacterium]